MLRGDVKITKVVVLGGGAVGRRGVGHFVVGTTLNYHFLDVAPYIQLNPFVCTSVKYNSSGLISYLFI